MKNNWRISTVVFLPQYVEDIINLLERAGFVITKISEDDEKYTEYDIEALTAEDEELLFRMKENWELLD